MGQTYTGTSDIYLKEAQLNLLATVNIMNDEQLNIRNVDIN